MLVAHLVPGYFAASKSQHSWKSEWSKPRRMLLWVAALCSTFAPDLDVIYNTFVRGFINHSTLWTHSLFVHGSVGLCWWVLRRFGRLPYLQTFTGLVAIGGISHLVLDVISHGTPLLYPLSMQMFGGPSSRVVEGGFWAYITDPIFLAEPILLALAAAHWISHQQFTFRSRRLALVGLATALAIFVIAFLLFLPMLQHAAEPLASIQTYP
jgi:hypothetical protein